MGYQADLGTLKGYLNGKFWGLLFDNCRRATLAGDSEANEKIVKMRDWNQYLIRAQGRRIQQWLNGRQVVDYTEKGLLRADRHHRPADPRRPADGSLVQGHRDQGTAGSGVPVVVGDRSPVIGAQVRVVPARDAVHVHDTTPLICSVGSRPRPRRHSRRAGEEWKEPFTGDCSPRRPKGGQPPANDYGFW